MYNYKMTTNLTQYKTSLSERLKHLRAERKLTQKDLAKILGLSQARFSKIENSKNSLTAEQFLFLLQQFNLSAGGFLLKKETPDEKASLQNALCRLGARHLREVPGLLVPEKFTNPGEVIIEILLTASSSRLITALVPLIVTNYSVIPYHLIADRLNAQKLANRFGWILEGTCRALEKSLSAPYLPHDVRVLYQKASILIERKLFFLEPFTKAGLHEDELDKDLLTKRTIELVQKSRDKEAEKWHIVTRIKKEDFEKALLEAEAYA